MADSTHEAAAEEDVETSDRWEDELIPGHEYDGIREYDNPVPGWLNLLLIGTVVWSLFYVVAINFGYIDDYQANLEEGQQELVRMRQKARAGQKKVTSDLLATVADDQERVKAGKTTYLENCASCHKKNGGGQIGPNLTDNYWVHGGSLKAVYETITNGVTDKGMPAWKSQLSQKERLDVTAYVRSLLGTNPSGAKKPEGEKFVPKTK